MRQNTAPAGRRDERISVNVPTTLKQLAAEKAEQEGRSLSGWVREVLTRELKDNKTG